MQTKGPDSMTPEDDLESGLESGIAGLAKYWKRVVAVGVVLMLCGGLALTAVVAATIASVFLVGAAMMIAGASEIVHAFGVRDWSRFFLWVALGILYTLAGLAAFVNPGLAAGVLTLLLGAGLVASGILRIVLAAEMREGRFWGWVAASGLITVLLGVMILFRWPESSLYVLGLFLGLDLVFAGAGWLAMGLALRGRL
jgi:uncharacterized membrane protein HdeD (DUF308 family)